MRRDPLHISGSRNGLKQRILLAALGLAALLPEAAVAQQFTVERVVLVSRHGVRAPTSMKSLTDYTKSRTWPAWPVAQDADLTARGEELVSLMGAFYRQHFAGLGVLPAAGCPAANQVYAYADVAQRTRRTGNALLAGAFPGCGLYAQHRLPIDKPDPLFHPVEAGVCPIDKTIARQEILKAAGGSLEQVLQKPPYRDAVSKLQSVLDCCQPRLCKSNDSACTLGAVPSGLEDKGDGLSLQGPIAIGSTASEVFLLEYAQGMRDVAWDGASTPDKLMPMLQLHDLQFDLMERTSHLAKRQGSALVYQVYETLRQTAERGPAPVAPPDGKLTVFVGHDTNIANIGGILGVDWQLKGYLRNETPPAGAMAFELLKDKTSGQYSVRLLYFSQTLDQMRNAVTLNATQPPDQASIPVCGNKDGVCAWADFAKLVLGALDMSCVVPTPR